MKKTINRSLLTATCTIVLFCAFLACTPAAKKVQWAKVGRYVNPGYGFSVEYDAEELTADQRVGGPFVFGKASPQGLPNLYVSLSPYPQGATLQDTTQMISNNLPAMVPGSFVHDTLNQEMVKLEDQTEANYFELKWNDGKRELVTSFVVVKKDDKMIVLSASGNPQESTDNISAMVKSLRLDVKVDLAALRKKGFGKDGTFVRTTSPAFTLRYPNEFQNQPLQPGQIFNAGTPGGSPSIGISIVPLQADADIQEQLQGFAAVYAGYLKPVGSDIKIVSNESIDEYKNFKAFRFEIVWRFQGQIPLTTVGDLIAKGNQAILVVGHTTYHIGELLDIFKTINLDP